MRRSQKSKRINWASDVNLCQVRLFLSEEAPAQVGVGTQDHLQAKTLWSAQSAGMASDDNLPPGFEGLQPANLWRNKLSQLPLIKWRCPPRFEVDGSWRVVAGEESKEVESQNQRGMRVLEAIYPRPSAIPPNPSDSIGVEDLSQNDQDTPVVPVTPIEDEDAAVDTPLASVHNAASMTSQPPPLAYGSSSSQVSGSINHRFGNPATGGHPGVGPDIVAAAHAALTAAMSRNKQGNLIDHNLLMKILSDPKMIEQLVSNRGTTSSMQNVLPTALQNKPFTGTQNMPLTSTHNMPSSSKSIFSNSSSISINRRDLPSAHVTRPELVYSPAASNQPFFPATRVAPVSNFQSSAPDISLAPRPPSVGAPTAKDINYYKSLIQQHGAGRPEPVTQLGSQSHPHFGTTQEPSSVVKSWDSKSKSMKPCMYFNSARGCRNGANCAFLHDTSSLPRVNSVPEVQNTKRMKMDREITGT